MDIIIGIIIAFVFLAAVGLIGFVVWRMAKGHSKLVASRTELKHKHYWSPWEPHEVALYDGSTLVRYAPGQLRTCLDTSCGAEDVRYTGGQTTAGDNDAHD